MSTQVLLAGTALVLAVAGLAAIAATRNVIKVVMGIQVITLAALLMLAAALAGADPPRPSQALLLLAVAAAAAEATGIAVLALVWEKHRTVDPHRVSELRG
uniref:NADH-quinone oxidoreductase subunit K n=1 Tax=Thermofilum pendens TaxID=2269 RepID=A0A7C3SN15_THEPE